MSDYFVSLGTIVHHWLMDRRIEAAIADENNQ